MLTSHVDNVDLRLSGQQIKSSCVASGLYPLIVFKGVAVVPKPLAALCK